MYRMDDNEMQRIKLSWEVVFVKDVMIVESAAEDGCGLGPVGGRGTHALRP